jgi:predicted RND superfamily exporter protein
VHIISRYREFRARGDVRSSITGAITTAGRGNITGSLASAIVFFMAFFTNFRGLQELGLIAGAGLLLCMISMTVVLPALLVIANRWRRGARQADGLEVEHPEDVAPGMLRSIIAHPRFVVIAALVLTLACSVGAARVHFEQNLLKLQAPGLDSVKWERRIAEDSASNTWFGVVIADAIEQIPDVAERALARPTIGEVHSVLDVVQLPTPHREQLRKSLHAQPSAAMPNPEAPKAWGRDALEHMVKRLKLMAFGARSQAPEEADRLTRIASDIDALTDQWRKSEAEIRQRIEQNIRSVGASTAAIIEGDSLGLREALPDGVRDQFMSKGGRFAVMLHPGSNVWEFEPMKAFVADMRAVNPNVTGVPITTYESLLDMRHAFGVMSILAVIVITGIVMIDFRRPLFIVLALLPMGMVALWTTEAMGLLNISFNLANFFSVPILIGLSVNGSVYVLHRYREGGPTRFNLGATRRAVILTALNTLIGFGALMAARHRGLRSLGEVMAIGSTACLVATVIVLPAILAWLESLRPPSREGST